MMKHNVMARLLCKAAKDCSSPKALRAKRWDVHGFAGAARFGLLGSFTALQEERIDERKPRIMMA
jgi:hypothetical protein